MVKESVFSFRVWNRVEILYGLLWTDWFFVEPFAGGPQKKITVLAEKTLKISKTFSLSHRTRCRVPVNVIDFADEMEEVHLPRMDGVMTGVFCLCVFLVVVLLSCSVHLVFICVAVCLQTEHVRSLMHTLSTRPPPPLFTPCVLCIVISRDGFVVLKISELSHKSRNVRDLCVVVSSPHPLKPYPANSSSPPFGKRCEYSVSHHPRGQA